MEAELIRENILTSYPSANLNLNIIAEGETIVPDTKKDISEIISVEGRSFIEKTEIQKGRIIITGTAEFTVLYSAENSEEICSLNTRIPFNHIEDCPSVSGDDKVSLHTETLHSECILLNSRKISLKSVIFVSFTSYLDLSLPVVTGIKCSEAEVKKEPETFSYLTACIEECFTISDFLTFPASSSPFESSLLCRVSVTDCSVKAVTGKAVAKGNLSVFHLYLTKDGTISHIEHAVPFTEIIDIPSLSDETVYHTNFYVKKFSLDESNKNSDERIFALSADICFSATAFETATVPVVTDAYIPGYDTKIVTSAYKKSELLCSEITTLTVKDTIDLPFDYPPMEQICPLYARVTGIKSETENGKITVTGTLDINVTYLASGGKNVISDIHESTFTHTFESPSECPSVYAKASVSHIDFNFINQSKLDYRCIVNLSAAISRNCDSFMTVDSIIIGEETKKKRPSIIIYFVKSGDTLWDIAKKYNTTIDKLIMANNLEKDDILNIGMRLLIPS